MNINLRELTNFPITKNKLLIKNLRKRDLEINPIIYIDEDFLRCIYYTLGDGSFIKGVYLSNITYQLHKDFIETFEKYFGIKRQEWDFSVTFNKNFNETQKQFAIKFWKAKLNIPDIKRVYSTDFNTCEVGAFKTIYDSINLSRLLLKILDYIEDKIKNDELTKRQLCIILDGILNAEGSPNKEKQGLHKIVISFNHNNQKEKGLFCMVLEKLKILEYARLEQNRKIVFSRWTNHYNFIKPFIVNNVIPFSLNPKRRKILLEGFLNHKRTKSLNRYICVLLIRNEQTIREMNLVLRYDESSICEALLRKFRNFGFFIVKGSGINKDPYRFTITNEGELFLKTVETCKLLLKSIKEDKHG